MTTANERPDWPGSKWWKFDLHAHTPASHDFRGEDKDFERWLTAAGDAGVDAVAVTDHNSSEAIAGMKEAATRVKNAPVIFPGVELTAEDGSHLILIMDPSTGRDHIQDLLSRAGIGVDERGKKEALSSLGVIQILDKFGDDAVVMAAHVNVDKVGILAKFRGRQRLNVLQHRNLAAVEIHPDIEINPDQDSGSLSVEAVQPWLDGSKTEIGRAIPQIYSSDSHSVAEVGKRFTWVKMTEPNLEGLRLALMDGDSSLTAARAGDSENPNARPSTSIEKIVVQNARYIGRGGETAIHFNPWLNAIIGGRGTGKSTLVDFCRKTLRRDGKLDGVDGEEVGELRSQFDNRMSLDGLLEDETVLEMVYVKDGQRFLLAWSQDGSAASISLLDGDRRIPEDGDIDISERFPARIYSQKQLFALGRNQSSLLQEIDDAPEVGASEFKGRIIHLGENYLALRAAARAARARASNLPSREAELRDARRKLDVIQNESGARAVNDYRFRRQANDAWDDILNKAEEVLNSERGRLDDIITSDLNLDGVDGPAAAALARARQSIASIMANLRQSVADSIDEAESGIRQIRAGADDAEWRASVETSRTEYEAALLILQEAGVSDLAEYDDIMNHVAKLESEIKALKNEKKEAEELENEAERKLAKRRQEIRDLSRSRRAFAAKTSSESVRVQVNELADSENLPKAIGDILGTDSFEKDRDAISDRVRPENGGEWDWRNLDRAVSEMRLFISGDIESWDSRDRRFETALKRAEPERIDRLALYAPRDGVDVSFKDERQVGGWRSLSQGSPGQQTAALLAFVLGFGSEPIILDQPEDDLDSALIYDLLVKRFKDKKRQRQVIAVTHNPNIVVHGDAEMVVSLDFHKGRTVIKRQGGIQKPEVRDEICRVMEGGREAFKMRYRRIMPRGETAP